MNLEQPPLDNVSPWRPPLRSGPVVLLDLDEEFDVDDTGRWPVVSRETWGPVD
jgi:hypothetical protein